MKMIWRMKGTSLCGNSSDQRLTHRRAIRSLSRLHSPGDPFLLLVHGPFVTLDKFVGLINESRSLALQILSPLVCLRTHQISSFISLASDSIASGRCQNRVQRG